jgi:CRISPR/Cas system-associated exonuclease Cas4 (RecB family)
MEKEKKTWLSHTALEALNQCPRCFWLSYRLGIRQPEGFTSRLPSRFDQIAKEYFNIFRHKREMPPIVKDTLFGQLEDPFQEVYFYSVDHKYGFYGKLDECLITPEGKYAPIDFKTSSVDPRNKRELFQSYQNQMDAYAFLLEEKGKFSAGFGYLIYFYPDAIKDLEQGVPMVVHLERVETSPKTILERIAKAVNVLESGMPEASEKCPFCQWREKIQNLKPVDIKGKPKQAAIF